MLQANTRVLNAGATEEKGENARMVCADAMPIMANKLSLLKKFSDLRGEHHQRATSQAMGEQNGVENAMKVLTLVSILQ